MKNAIQFLHQHRDEHVDWLRQLCRIPSISTQDEHKRDVHKAIEWVHDVCRSVGLKAEIHDTALHPILYAEWCQAPGAPIYLVYGHADVQPAGDPALWDADPFEPIVKDDWLICRGSADDKGPLLVYVRAAQAWLATAGKLPINLKLLVEGEEEIGSPNLMPFVRDRADLLKCDGILISDTSLFDDGLPTITYGTRGICYKEVRLSGPKFNLHSGSHGGPVTNPGNALARLIASLHDERGCVNIPGFYDDVRDISEEERALAARFPLDEQSYAAELGVPGLAGEEGYSVGEQRSARPTLDVNGIYGGYVEEGASTVIPAIAGAKISMRLVPNQICADIGAKFDRTIRERCPHTVRCEILEHACAEPYVVPLNWQTVKVAEKALKAAFDRDVAFVREGGTLPILRMFKEHLGADSLLLGLASPRCNAHGPNEKVNLPDLDRGAEAVVRLLEHLQ